MHATSHTKVRPTRRTVDDAGRTVRWPRPSRQSQMRAALREQAVTQ